MKMITSFSDLDSVDELGLPFLGLQLYQLLSIINIQGNELLKMSGLDIPSSTVSTLMLLKSKGSMSVTGLGSALNMSHQLVAHRINPLKEKELIIDIKDPKDGRKTLYILSKKGEEVINSLQKIMRESEKAYKDLFEEIGVDLFESLKQAKKSLLKKTIYQRI